MTEARNRVDPRATLEELAARARAGELRAAPRQWAGGTEGYRRAAVMILFTPTDTVPSAARPGGPATAGDAGASGGAGAPPGVDIFLVQRADHLRSHPGEISLPGGRIDADDADEVAAALRELAEETGLDPAVVEVLGQLPPQVVPVSRNVVTPVLGWSDAVGDATEIEPGEVVHTLRVPVAEMLDPAARTTVLIRGHRTPGFATRTGWVWGFTGLLLDHLFTELGWTRPWDTSREVRMVYDPLRGRIVVR